LPERARTEFAYANSRRIEAGRKRAGHTPRSFLYPKSRRGRPPEVAKTYNHTTDKHLLCLPSNMLAVSPVGLPSGLAEGRGRFPRSCLPSKPTGGESLYAVIRVSGYREGFVEVSTQLPVEQAYRGRKPLCCTTDKRLPCLSRRLAEERETYKAGRKRAGRTPRSFFMPKRGVGRSLSLCCPVSRRLIGR
jgi:hypothetical protein